MGRVGREAGYACRDEALAGKEPVGTSHSLLLDESMEDGGRGVHDRGRGGGWKWTEYGWMDGEVGCPAAQTSGAAVLLRKRAPFPAPFPSSDGRCGSTGWHPGCLLPTIHGRASLPIVHGARGDRAYRPWLPTTRLRMGRDPCLAFSWLGPSNNGLLSGSMCNQSSNSCP